MPRVAPAPPTTPSTAGAGSIPSAASTALGPLLEGTRRGGRVLAAFPTAIYIELDPLGHRDDTPEPRVVALVKPEAVRLPIAIVATSAIPFESIPAGTRAALGAGQLRIGRLRTHVARWWRPEPAIGSVSPQGLRMRLDQLRSRLDRARTRPGLAGHALPDTLAHACADGDLATAVDAAEQLVGLGPGLTPSGDDLLAGVLLSLRLLGRGMTGDIDPGNQPIMFADWLGVAVTRDARTRTTAIAATLLHCAAGGLPTMEVGAVLAALAGHAPLDPALHRLFSVGHTSGVDLGYGLLAGGCATLGRGLCAA